MKLITSIFLLMAFQTFAGEAHLVCHDKADNLIADQLVDSKLTSSLEFNDMYTDQYSIEVAYNPITKDLSYKIFEMNSMRLMEESSTKVDYYDEVQIISGYYCHLGD